MSAPRNGIGVPDLSRAGRAARRKGGVGEREVAHLAHSHGFTEARRNFQSGGQGGGDIIGVPGLHLEVKFTERCSPWLWIAQVETDARASDTPVIAFRRSRSAYWALTPLDDLFAWVKVAQS